MLSKDVCRKCECGFMPIRKPKRLDRMSWSCLIKVTGGAQGYQRLDRKSNLPRHCCFKLEHFMAMQKE